jgi:type IV pilus assembly protein PilM
MPRTLIGLDLGSGVIRAAEVQPNPKGRPQLHRYAEVAVPASAINEGVVADEEAVVAALKQLWSEARFKSRSVVIGIGSQQVLTRELVLPRMPLEQLRETLPFRVQDLLPLPVEQALLDFFPLEEVDGEEGPQLRGLLVAATRESVTANTRAIAAAGLRVIDVDLIPFAVSRVQLEEHDGPGAEVLVHIGAPSTSIVVAEGGIPQFVRTLPAGGADITEAIAERLRIDEAEAEALKRRVGMVEGTDPAARTAAQVAGEVAAELVRAVRSTIAFYTNAHPGASFGGVVLSGGGGALVGFADALGAAVGLPVMSVAAGVKFSVGPRVDQESFFAAGPAPTVALGLTMRSPA